MLEELQQGTEYTSSKIVEKNDTAIEMNSGGLEVFSTPSMIALMENAAYQLLKQEPYNEESVGTLIDVVHTRACLIGTKVYATAKVKDVNERKINFEVRAFDDKGEIGYGRHTRYIIIPDKFMSKL